MMTGSNNVRLGRGRREGGAHAAGRGAGRALGVILVLAAAQGAAAEPLDGASLFQQNCAACHQPMGQGVPGAFPALAGDKIVQGPGAGMAVVVINGRGGMPAFGGDLSDDTIAAIMSYVRSSWGNKAAPVSPAEVAAARASTGVEHAASALQAH